MSKEKLDNFVFLIMRDGFYAGGTKISTFTQFRLIHHAKTIKLGESSKGNGQSSLFLTGTTDGDEWNLTFGKGPRLGEMTADEYSNFAEFIGKIGAILLVPGRYIFTIKQ